MSDRPAAPAPSGISAPKKLAADRCSWCNCSLPGLAGLSPHATWCPRYRRSHPVIQRGRVYALAELADIFLLKIEGDDPCKPE